MADPAPLMFNRRCKQYNKLGMDNLLYMKPFRASFSTLLQRENQKLKIRKFASYSVFLKAGLYHTGITGRVQITNQNATYKSELFRSIW
jgi:hypothetical protein